MRRFAVILVAGLALAGPVAARQSIGIYDGWGVFRDAPPTRCYAIAEAEGKASGAWQPFATISWWPERGVKGQLHFRLSRERREGADVMLRIGNRRWRLTPGRADAWSPSPRHDAFMLARLRSAQEMTVASVSAKGTRFVDTYRLDGAASAIDAAALSCARRG
jgi:hypothetical protein